MEEKVYKWADIKVMMNGKPLSELNIAQPDPIDLSSTEPHLSIHCPFCNFIWAAIVDDEGNCPSCDSMYTMKELNDDDILVKFTKHLSKP